MEKNVISQITPSRDSSIRGVYPEAPQTLRFAQGDEC